MAQRETKQRIEQVFDLVCREMGWSQETSTKLPDGSYRWNVGAVTIDNNGTYGGRQVEMITNDSGSARILTPGRLKGREFVIWCRGVLLAKEYSCGKDNSPAA